MQICNGACKAVSAYGGCSMKIEYPSRVKKSTLSRGSVLFLSSGLRPPLTGIRISCSTGATELAAGESGKPVLIILEVRHMKLYVVLALNEVGMMVQESDPHTLQELPPVMEDYLERDDTERLLIIRYEPYTEQAAQDDETFWMI